MASNGSSGNGKPQRKICGDFGGIKRDGKPCNRPAIDRPCEKHSRNPKAAARQEAFLACYVECGGSLKDAVKMAGLTNRHVHYRYLAADPEYAAAFERAKEEMIRVKVETRRALAQEARKLHLKRLQDGSASPAEIIFAEKNCPDDPWTDRQEHFGQVSFTLADAILALDGKRPEIPCGR